jgi:hypothetical protein
VAFVEKTAIGTFVNAETSMPCTVTAFSVKIACPGDGVMEMTIAREVIAHWNSHHALEEKRILLPLDEEAASENASQDLLVEFFSDLSEIPDMTIPGDADSDIDRQIKDGKPVLVYFSHARGDLNRSPQPRGCVLDDFKQRHVGATVDSYGDEKEFRAKFSQQLDAVISDHAHFKPIAPLCDAKAVSVAPRPAPVPLSACAREILVEACDDFEAYIGRIKVGNMLRIQANGKQLVEPQDAASIAKWDAAFNELLLGDYIRDAGCNGQLFQISTKGFEFLKTIGKTPIGYIAELGGM